jgi:hypothetical protein
MQHSIRVLFFGFVLFICCFFSVLRSTLGFSHGRQRLYHLSYTTTPSPQILVFCKTLPVLAQSWVIEAGLDPGCSGKIQGSSSHSRSDWVGYRGSGRKTGREALKLSWGRLTLKLHLYYESSLLYRQAFWGFCLGNLFILGFFYICFLSFSCLVLLLRMIGNDRIPGCVWDFVEATGIPNHLPQALLVSWGS